MVGHFVHLLSSEFQLVVCLYCFQIHTDGLSDFALEAKSWARVCSLEARASACSVEAQQLVSHDVDAKLIPLVLICPPGHPIFELSYDIRGLLPLRNKTCDTGFLSLKIVYPSQMLSLYTS
jgi:hypothetical protein